jgi:WD40 repeat protein/serine/threonine protein kinase
LGAITLELVIEHRSREQKMSSIKKCPTCGENLEMRPSGAHCLRCLLTLALTAQEPEAETNDGPNFEQPGDQIGPYKLLYQIGEGGCGIVYLAEQEAPVFRHVALKVIKLGMDTRSVIARFEAERQAMALMDHPNIAKVFDAGSTRSGRPFFVMELVRGVKITEFCDCERLSIRERLDLFVQVCQAIQHAHQKGVIHRDIKPSNILVTLNDGIGVPKVIDFGIAKATQQPLTDKTLFTALEQFLGTPAYMSPEQADMNSAGVDTRSDIYSLGVLLYELLTGQTPFDTVVLLKGGFEEIRRTIREREPAPPSARLNAFSAADLVSTASRRKTEGLKLVKALRGDLDWIVLKALEKDRAHRYETANGLAMDIQRYLNDEAVAASPPGKCYRLQKLIRRNKIIFAASGLVVLALVLGLALATWQYAEKSRAELEQNRQRQKAQLAEREEARLRQLAQMQEFDARRKAYAVSMNLLQRSLAEDDLGRAIDLLDQQRPRPGQADLRGWEWRYLWKFCRSDAKANICNRANTIAALSFSADERSMAVETDDGEISVWEIGSTNMVFHTQLPQDSAHRLSFGREDNWLAYADSSNIVVWDSAQRRIIKRFPISPHLLYLGFLTGNRLIAASLSGPDNITIWNVRNSVREFCLSAPIRAVGVGMRFTSSSDASVMAFALSNNIVRVLDRAHGTNGWDMQAGEELTTAMALSPDGRILATGTGYTESAIELWDVENRKCLGKLNGNRSWVEYLKFNSDGTLVSAGADRTVRLWNVAERKLTRTFRGHHAEVRVVAIASDGRTIASGDKDGAVLLWDAISTEGKPPEMETINPRYHPGKVTAFTFSPDSQTIAVCEDDIVKLYDAATLSPRPTPALGLQGAISDMLFSPDSRLLVAASADGKVAVWNLPEQRPVTNFIASPVGGGVIGSSFVKGGLSLLTWGYDNVAREWDSSKWQMTTCWSLLPGDKIENTLCSANSTNDLLVLYQSQTSVLQLLDVNNHGERKAFECPYWTSGVAISPDGKTIAASCEDGALTLWDTHKLVRTDRIRSVLLGLHSVAFSPDGKRIAAGSNGNEAVKIWDAYSHEDLLTLIGKGSVFSDTSFSPDGSTIAACGWSGVLHVWRAPSWEQTEVTDARKPRSVQKLEAVHIQAASW